MTFSPDVYNVIMTAVVSVAIIAAVVVYFRWLPKKIDNLAAKLDCTNQGLQELPSAQTVTTKLDELIQIANGIAESLPTINTTITRLLRESEDNLGTELKSGLVEIKGSMGDVTTGIEESNRQLQRIRSDIPPSDGARRPSVTSDSQETEPLDPNESKPLDPSKPWLRRRSQ